MIARSAIVSSTGAASVARSGQTRKRLGVGIVGCGVAAKVLHLPRLASLDGFEVQALCDRVPSRAASLARRYGVAQTTTDWRELVARDGVDVVAVCTRDHDEIAIGAIAAGRHVFVEKPISLTPDGAKRIVEAAERNKRVLAVGYMKAFDPAFQAADRRIRAVSGLRLIRVHDFRGGAVAASGAPPANADASAVRALLGPNWKELGDSYLGLLMLGSHDLAMLRRLLGHAEEVEVSARLPHGGLLAMIRYGRSRRAVLELDRHTEYRWFDEVLSAYGENASVELRLANPYRLDEGSRLTVRRCRAGSGSFTEHTVTYHADPFVTQWLHIYDCVVHGYRPVNDGPGAAEDVELAEAIVRALPGVCSP